MSISLHSIEFLENKLNVLLSNYDFLKKENDILMEQNRELQILIQQKEQLLQNQDDLLDSLKAAKTIEGSIENVQETKRKINALIREIDKCIVQLNR